MWKIKNQRSGLSKYVFLRYYALADGRTSVKKKEISSYLVYNVVSLGKLTGKTKPFQEVKLNMNFQSNI